MTTVLAGKEYQTYYRNAEHMIASDNNGAGYVSNDSVFTIPHSALRAGFRLTVSGLDKTDSFYETDTPGDADYHYRVTDQNGKVFQSGVSIGQSVSDGKVTVTVTPDPGSFSGDFVFRLQRRVNGLQAVTNDQNQVVDDQYRDVPDYCDLNP